MKDKREIGLRLLLSLILTLTLLAGMPGCAGSLPSPQPGPDQAQASSWKLIAFNTLAESKIAYDKAFTALGLANQAGKLSPTDKARAIKYGNMYRDAHNSAVHMLLNNMQPNLGALKSALALFESVALPYITRGVS